ncbi:MAG: GGDEF domain-containing protein [Deltaproteobacteria bacterium]|nr:GGDEF domain-containing protein [Deltaproteobacteria bacterium]
MNDEAVARLALLTGIGFLAAGAVASSGYDLVVAPEHVDRLLPWRLLGGAGLLAMLAGAYLVPGKRTWWLAGAASVAAAAVCGSAHILPSGFGYGMGGLALVAMFVAVAAPGGRAAAAAAAAAVVGAAVVLVAAGASRWFIFPLAFVGLPAFGAAVAAGAAAGLRARRRRDREDELDRLRHDLERFGRTDELTGVPDKKQMERLARRELALARRRGVALSVIKLDVEGLEGIRQSHGRSAGDEVLRAVASMCQGALRETDMIARIAADQFVALVMDADGAGAAALCERLRLKLKNAPLLAGDKLIEVNVSVGAATLIDGDQHIDDLVARAERALHAERAPGAGNGDPGAATA